MYRQTGTAAFEELKRRNIGKWHSRLNMTGLGEITLSTRKSHYNQERRSYYPITPLLFLAHTRRTTRALILELFR